MKFSIVALTLAAGFASAQLNDVPKCAQGCITEYTTGSKIADCEQLDIKCICSNKQFLDGIACCLDKSCDATGKKDAIAFAQQICSTANVSVPDQIVCNSDSSSSSAASDSSSTAAASSGSSSTATKTESKGTSTATSTQSAASASGTDKGAASPLSPIGGTLGAAVALLFAL